MFLEELHVTNFRAIRNAGLRFEASTTLIGENGCGISSLLAALTVALRPDEEVLLSSSDVHRPNGVDWSHEPVRIRVTFREQTDGEWDAAWHQPLHAHLPDVAGRRQLALEVSATPPASGGTSSFMATVSGVRGDDATRAVVRHLRAMTPVLRIGAGALTAHSGSPDVAELTFGATVSPPVATLVRRIVASADAVLGGTAADRVASIAAGADAARALLALSPRHIDPVRAGLAHPVLEILGLPVAGGVSSAPADASGTAEPSGTAADRLGMLLLLAGILRGLPDGLPPGAAPLCIIEDPEAHLHPMTVAAMLGVLARIRWQKVVTTQSGDLLAAAPLAQVRRLVRHDGCVRVSGVTPRSLSREHLRRVGYHLRVHRGVAMFARVWLLVEGESEHWILPQVAQVLGYNLATEGICCVGFAQCGLAPLVRTAQAFGIEWHLLADGDEAGQQYVAQAQALAGSDDLHARITGLDEPDIEHCFWHHGHADVIGDVAGTLRRETRATPRQTIAKAVKRRSKPYLALKLVESVAARGPSGVPAPLAALIETCVGLARHPRSSQGSGGRG